MSLTNQDSDRSGSFGRNKLKSYLQIENMHCKNHPSDKVTLYCYPCKEPMCIECLRIEHKSLDHHYESIYQTEPRLDGELIDLDNKINYLKEVRPPAEKVIDEIDFQYRQVEERINDTYQVLEVFLKKCRDDSLSKLIKLQRLRKVEVVESYSEIIKCLQGLEENIQKCATQLSNNDDLLDQVACKENLVKEYVNCTNKITKLNDKLHVDFNEFKEKCSLQIIDEFNEAFQILMFQRINHSSNPFINKSAPIQSRKHMQVNANGHVNDGNTDIDSNSSLRTSMQNQDSLPLSPEQAEEAKEVTEAEETSNKSDETNDLAGAKDVNKNYELAKSFQRFNFPPQILKLVHRFNDHFLRPQDFCLNANGDIIVADTGNHLIKIYDRNGNSKLSFGTKGDRDGCLIYPKYLSTFNNTNSKNSGKIVIYDKIELICRKQTCRLQIFTEAGVFLQSGYFENIGILRSLTTTMDDRIVTIDVNKQIFIISDTLLVLNKIDCHQFLRKPLSIAMKGNEIFITDLEKYFITVINEEGQYLGRIGYRNQQFAPQGICFVDNKISFSVTIPKIRVVKFYEYSENGNCTFKYEMRQIKVLPYCDKYVIGKDGTFVLLNKMSSNTEILILRL